MPSFSVGIFAFTGCDAGGTARLEMFPFFVFTAFTPFFPWLDPGGQSGEMVGIGIGLVGGIAVFDKPCTVFSRGLARRSGFTDFEVAEFSLAVWLSLSLLCDGLIETF